LTQVTALNKQRNGYRFRRSESVCIDNQRGSEPQTIDGNEFKSCVISNQVSRERVAVFGAKKGKEKVKRIKVTRCNSAEHGFHRRSGCVTTIDRKIFTGTRRIVTISAIVLPAVTGTSKHHDDDKSDHLYHQKKKLEITLLR